MILIKKNDVLQTLVFQPKKAVSRSVLGEVQLTQISLICKTSCCNLRGFSALLLLKGVITFKNLSFTFLLSRKLNFNKNGTGYKG